MARKTMKGTEVGIVHTGEKAKGSMTQAKANALDSLSKPACSQ